MNTVFPNIKTKYALAYMDMAERWGLTSTANRAKVGALLVKNDSIISVGVNGNPPGWDDEVCEGEDGKTLPWVRHAEIACLEKAWKLPISTDGAVMFTSLAPCLSCAIKIHTAGIVALYYRKLYSSDEGLRYLITKDVHVGSI